MINRTVSRQALLLLMVAVVIYMGAGFVRQTAVGRQQREVLRLLDLEIEAATHEQASLQAQLEYVQSPQAAEEWARENGWARPDEQLVVIVAPPADSMDPADTTPAEAGAPESVRQSWWDLFFADQ